MEVSQPTLLAACGPPRFGELARAGVWGEGCVWLVGRACPSCSGAPRHLGRVLASSCDTGMYFHALFPTYRYIHRAHALQRSHYLTLPRYSRLTYSCPPRPAHFRLQPEIGERRSAGAKVSRRPGCHAWDQISPLSAASKPALHPAPAFFLRTTTIPHLQAAPSPTLRNGTRPCPGGAQLSCATPSHSCIAASSHARSPLSSDSQSLLRFRSSGAACEG